MTDTEYLTTKEVAVLLRIKERKVYDLAAEQQIPCTRATGKLLFSRNAIDQWLVTHSSGEEQFTERAQMLFSGSHDPVLEWAIRESQCGIPTLFDGSADGVSRVLNNKAGVSALHIYASDTDEWNAPAVKVLHKTESVVLLKWLVRQRGIVAGPDVDIAEIKDLSNYRVVSRQRGSGSQLLLEHLLHRESIAEHEINSVITARSEDDLALAVAQNKADCGLGLASLAQQHNLKFVPIVDEQLDLLVDRRFWFEPQMQAFVRFCSSDAFASYVDSMRGYRCDKMFEVCVNF